MEKDTNLLRQTLSRLLPHALTCFRPLTEKNAGGRSFGSVFYVEGWNGLNVHILSVRKGDI